MKVFASVIGQEDNIGDIVLRRRLLKTASKYGPLYIFSGDHSSEYVRGLNCNYEENFSSPDPWWTSLLDAARREPVLLFEKPGELQSSWKSLRARLKVRVRRFRLRRNGGAAVLLGVGMKNSLPWSKRMAIRTAMSDYQLLGWRDIRSRDELGIGDVMPDWAFGEQTDGPDRARDLMVVSMRGDRPSPGPRWFAALRTYAAARDLTIEVVTQVGRDEPRSREIAAQLGVVAQPWLRSDYARQEEALRALYRAARLVVSDRMHVLVVASVEGAVPLCLTEAPEQKIERHFRAVDFPGVSRALAALSDADAQAVLDRQAGRADELRAKVDAARDAIGLMEQRLDRVVSEIAAR